MAGALLTGWSGQARATPTTRLVYARGPGAEQCPAEAELHDAVKTRLGYDPFFAFANTTIVAVLTKDAGEFRATVQVIDGDSVVGSRTLHSASANCAEIVRALALDLSIVVDDLSNLPLLPPANPPPQQQASPAPPPPLSSPAPDLPAHEQPDPPPASTQATLPRAPIADSRPLRLPANLRFAVGAGVLGSLGSAPAVAGGIVLFAELRWKSLGMELEGRGDFPSSTPLSGGGDVRSFLFAGSLLGCFHGGVPFVCGMASLGSVTGGGVNIATPNTSAGAFVATGVRVGVRIPLFSVLFLRLHADAAYALARVSIQIDHREVFSVNPVIGSAGLATEFDF